MANFEPDHPLGDSKCYRKKLETFNITDSLPGWRMSLLCRFITAKKKNQACPEATQKSGHETNAASDSSKRCPMDPWVIQNNQRALANLHTSLVSVFDSCPFFHFLLPTTFHTNDNPNFNHAQKRNKCLGIIFLPRI